MVGWPNVLLLVVDSLRYDVVIDSELAETPTFDTLAENWTNFERCISQGISTAPSMTAMLTGRYPLDYGGHWYIHDAQPTIAGQFKQNGYTTGAIHSNPNISRLRNFDKGFETFNENLLSVGGDRLNKIVPDTGLRYLNKAMRILSRTPYLPATAVNTQLTDWLDAADEPWFLWTQYMDTHGPYLPGQDFTYRNKLRAERLWRKAAVDAPESITSREHEELWRNYCLEVEYLDAAICRFLERLDREGHLENTIVVLVSDHGDEFGEHGRYGHSNLPYEELVHVPLLVRIPAELDVDPPPEVGSAVRSVDILPTVLDLVGAELDPTMQERMAGRSLRKVLTHSGTAGDVFVTEKEVRGGDALRLGFRDDRWTYLFDGRNDREFLFDRNADPEEVMDVSEDNPGIVERFQGYLDDRFVAIEATSTVIDTPTIEESPAVQERLRALGYRE